MIQERRKAPRYRLDAVIAVGDRTGRTLDISSNGVYFESDTRYSPGDALSLVLPLPQIGADATVECSGTVVRVDVRGAMFGVAATYEPTSFNVPA